MFDDLRVETFDERRALQSLVNQRAHHRQQQGHQQRRRTPLAGDVAQRQQHAAIGQREDVVEIAAHGVGRTGHPERLESLSLIRRPRQHRLLNLARDFQVVLQRQSIRDFEHHQQVHEQEAEQQPDRSRREHRVRDQEQMDSLKQFHEAHDGREQRDAVDRPPRRRQLQRERQEEQPCVHQRPPIPRQFLQPLEVDVAREEAIGLRCVAREEALDVARGQPPSVGLEELAVAWTWQRRY